MALRLVTAATAEPLTLAELRLHCKVDGTADDDVLTAAIAGARDLCQQQLGRALITQTWEVVLDAWPAADGAIELAMPPVQSITQVQYVPSGSTTLTMLDGAQYVLDNLSDSFRGWLMPATTWPAAADLANAVRVRFVTGYGADGAAVPAAIRSWLLLTAAFLYAHREAMDATGRVAALPGRFVDSLLDPYRAYTL